MLSFPRFCTRSRIGARQADEVRGRHHVIASAVRFTLLLGPMSMGLMLASMALRSGPVHAQAAVYKCVDAQGGIVYQQDPCSPNSSAGRMPPNTSVPPLAQIRPNDRSIDQCLKLHDYTRTAPDFQLRSASFVPVGDGSYQLALTGTVPANAGAPAGRSTIRCPVTGDGTVNLDLWRAQRGLANVQKPGSALTGTPPVQRVTPGDAGTSATGQAVGSSGNGGNSGNSGNTGNSGNSGSGGGSVSGNNGSGSNAGPPPLSAAERAAERRFIGATISTAPLKVAEVRERLGDPDNLGSLSGQCGPSATIEVGSGPCKLTTWIYEPSPLDPQTRTTILFSEAGETVGITRELVR